MALEWDFPIPVVSVNAIHHTDSMLTLEKLQEIVVSTGIELKNHMIDPAKTFQENGIDSLDTMTLLLNIEEASGLKFTEEEVESIKTFNDILEIAGKR